MKAWHAGLLAFAVAGCGGDDPQGPVIPQSISVEIVLDSWTLDDPGFQRDSLLLWRGAAERIHTEPLPAAGAVILRYEVPCQNDGTLTGWYLNIFVTWVGEGEVNQNCKGGIAKLDGLQCTDSWQVLSDFLHDSAYCTPPAN